MKTIGLKIQDNFDNVLDIGINEVSDETLYFCINESQDIFYINTPDIKKLINTLQYFADNLEFDQIKSPNI